MVGDNEFAIIYDNCIMIDFSYPLNLQVLFFYFKK